MPGCIDMLRAEHRSVEAALQALLQLLGSARARASRPIPELLWAMVDAVRSPAAAQHHSKEEVLFRLLRARAPELGAELDELSRHHLRNPCLIGAVVDAVERYCGGAATQEELEWAIETYVKFLREHMRREETLILPAAEQNLTESDWQEIHAVAQAHRDLESRETNGSSVLLIQAER